MIVELEEGVWIAEWEGDPGRTCAIENAQEFAGVPEADEALRAARIYRPFKNASIIWNDNTPVKSSEHSPHCRCYFCRIEGHSVGPVPPPETAPPVDCEQSHKDFQDKVLKLTAAGAAIGLDVMVVTRNQWGRTFTTEHHARLGAAPICYRFNEVSTCRTKIIDAALLLRDCFIEAATSHRKCENFKPEIEIKDYQPATRRPEAEPENCEGCQLLTNEGDLSPIMICKHTEAPKEGHIITWRAGKRKAKEGTCPKAGPPAEAEIHG